MVPTPLLERCVYIGAPSQTVWNALVTPEIVNKYHLVNAKKIELKVGGKVIYGYQDRIVIEGIIDEIEPGVKLVHTFSFLTHPEDAPSHVTYRIEPIGSQMCSLYLRHEGFLGETATFQDVSKGWDEILSCLKTLLETGSGLPWPPKTS